MACGMSCLLLNNELLKHDFIGLHGYFPVIASEARQSIVTSLALTSNENSLNAKMDCRASLAVTG
jgi:hypothetical protein